jgi:HD-like signal output (HDOD) protein
MNLPPHPSSAGVAADALETFLAELEGEGDLPAFVENVRAITTTTRDSDASGRLLADVLRRDVALTTKVLRTANSIVYNRTAKPIVDLEYAVLVMGFDRVQDLAVSATLFDHLRRRAPGLRELMVLSLLSANHAVAVALRVRHPAIEEVYLCGMFRTLGEIVLACYRVEYYAELLEVAEVEGLPLDRAARRLFGFGLYDLGVAVARRMELPRRIVRTIGADAAIDGGTLGRIAQLGSSLTDAVYRGDPELTELALNRLADQEGQPLRLSRQDLADVIRESWAETEETLRLFKVPVESLSTRSVLAEARAVLETDPRARARRALRSPGLRAALVQERDPRLDLLAETIATLERMSDADESLLSINGVIETALERLCRCGWDRALLALVTDDRTALRARAVYPRNRSDLAEGFRIPLSALGNPLGGALLRNEDLLLHREDAGRFRNDPLVARLQPQTFAMLPLVVDRVLIGCLYFDHPTVRVQVNQALHKLLLELRGALVRVFSRRG